MQWAIISIIFAVCSHLSWICWTEPLTYSYVVSYNSPKQIFSNIYLYITRSYVFSWGKEYHNYLLWVTVVCIAGSVNYGDIMYGHAWPKKWPYCVSWVFRNKGHILLRHILFHGAYLLLTNRKTYNYISTNDFTLY